MPGLTTIAHVRILLKHFQLYTQIWVLCAVSFDDEGITTVSMFSTIPRRSSPRAQTGWGHAKTRGGKH